MNDFDTDDFLPPPTGRSTRPAENTGSDTFENGAQSTADIPPTFESLQADHLLVEDVQNDSAPRKPLRQPRNRTKKAFMTLWQHKP